MNPRRRFLHYAVAGLASGCSVALASAPARVYRVGYLSARATHSAVDDAFAGGMRELGYTIGHNLLIEYRWAGNDAKRLGPLADELVRLNVDIIVTATTAGTRAAMRATRTIPIVMAASADPVRAGLVASLGRPGGNVTGISLQTTDVAQKRLQLLREIVPGARRIALLAERLSDPSQGTTGLFLAETQAAAETVGADLVARQIAHAGELAEAFESYRRERAQALIVQVSPLLLEHRFTITGSAAQARLPAMYETRDFVEAGGLVAYGPDLRANYRRAAAYVDRIFKGANPGNLPVEQPAKLELIVNLKAANAMGLTIPQSVLVQASEVT